MLRATYVVLPLFGATSIYLAIETLVLRFFGAGGDRQYHLGERAIGLADFWAFAVVVLIVCAFVAGCGAYALYRGRSWVRVPLVSFLPLAILVRISAPLAAGGELYFSRGIISWSIVSVLVWWYLYRKQNVVQYVKSRAATSEVDLQRPGSETRIR